MLNREIMIVFYHQLSQRFLEAPGHLWTLWEAKDQGENMSLPRVFQVRCFLRVVGRPGKGDEFSSEGRFHPKAAIQLAECTTIDS